MPLVYRLSQVHVLGRSGPFDTMDVMHWCKFTTQRTAISAHSVQIDFANVKGYWGLVGGISTIQFLMIKQRYQLLLVQQDLQAVIALKVFYQF